MKPFSSFSAVIALWLGVSFVLWLSFRTVRNRSGNKRLQLGLAAAALVDEGCALYTQIRVRQSRASAARRAGPYDQSEEDLLRDDVRALLNAIEANSAFFERVHALHKPITKSFKLADFAPLTELLQIRRDFWAASEVLLIEDIRMLGVELADDASCKAFRQEAQDLLFGEETGGLRAITPSGAPDDALFLRLVMAQEEARAFVSELENDVARKKEVHRLPTLSEVVLGPWRMVKALIYVVKEARDIAADISTSAKALARSMSFRGLKGVVQELRRTRTDLPDQFASAFERAGGIARQGGGMLKRHYEFLLEARELRARYAEILVRAPIVTEKGKQFLQRLELEKRAEHFRESSEGILAWLRVRIVIAIAYLIRGLQFVQAKITPRQNKQLATVTPPWSSVSAGGDEDAEVSPAAFPLRVMLPFEEDEDELKPSFKRGQANGKSKGKPRKTSPIEVMDKPASLMDRLAAIDGGDLGSERIDIVPPVSIDVSVQEKRANGKARKRKSGLFRG